MLLDLEQTSREFHKLKNLIFGPLLILFKGLLNLGLDDGLLLQLGMRLNLHVRAQKGKSLLPLARRLYFLVVCESLLAQAFASDSLNTFGVTVGSPITSIVREEILKSTSIYNLGSLHDCCEASACSGGVQVQERC